MGGSVTPGYTLFELLIKYFHAMGFTITLEFNRDMHRRSVKENSLGALCLARVLPALGEIDHLAKSTHTDSEAAAFVSHRLYELVVVPFYSATSWLCLLVGFVIGRQ